MADSKILLGAMPPDKDSVKSKLLQTYLNTYGQATVPGSSILGENNDEAADAGVTYFVDEEGRYYYQSSDQSQNIVAIPPDEDDDGQLSVNIPQEAQVLVQTEGYQTVTLVPSETNTGEVSYVLVVQEENKPVVKLDIKQDKNEDVYTFDEDEDVDAEQSTEAVTETSKSPTKSKRKLLKRNSVVCPFCPYRSHRRYLLLRHMNSHSEERPFKCEVCERGFKTLPSLQNHVNMHNGVKPHVCKDCGNRFTTSGELVRHVRYKHTHEKPHKCTECDYASVELSKLRRHVRCHTGERPYQCPHCTYASPDTFKLKRHLRRHTGEKPYQCELCNVRFTQSNSLKAHKLIHNIGQKPVYACELCPAKCGRKTDLRIHIQKLHTSDTPLKCKRCGKSFPDRYSCKVHNKTHEGEKCFKCDLCPYASTMLRHLKSHMLKHTDEKPFACDQCDQEFRQKQLLRRHQNIYHNPDYVPKPPKEKTHSCNQCPRTFAHKGNLIRHLAVHDPESGHQERALALKIGRNKRVKMVNGKAVPIDNVNKSLVINSRTTSSGMVSSSRKPTQKELKTGEMVTVSDGDGQQYVVLEVIQLEDGTEQHVAVVSQDYVNEQGLEYETLQEDEDEDQEPEMEEIEEELEEEEVDNKELALLPEMKQIKLEQDVTTCFGFDEEDEEEEEEEEMEIQYVN